MVETIVIYNCLLLICLILCWSANNSPQQRTKKTLLFLCYASIFLVGACRWDIGNDFYNYYKQCTIIQRDIFYDRVEFFSGHYELFHLLLNYIFQKFAYPNLWVINAYLFFTLLIFYKINSRYNTHTVGIFTFLTFCYFFFCLDVIRQGLSIMITLYVIPYLEQKQFRQYLIGILIASCIHYSALIMIIGYFILQNKPRTTMYLVIIGILLIGYQFLYWEQFRVKIFKLIPYYSYYADSAWQLKTRHIGSGISVIIYTLVAASIIYTNRNRSKVFSNMAFWGISIYLIACGNHNIERISYYFLYSIIISLPLSYKDKRYRFYYNIILLILFTLFERRCIDDPRGNTPYRSIFSNEFKIQYLRPRKYAK